MPILKILNREEREEFDNPPKFSSVERKKYFRLNSELRAVVDRLKTPVTKVAFVLMCGYCKARCKIFRNHNLEDVEFVCHQLGLKIKGMDFSSFDRFNLRKHKHLISTNFGYKDFGAEEDNIVRNQIRFSLRSQRKHRQIFGEVADKLVKENILLPSYNTLASIIEEESRGYDRSVEAKLRSCLSADTIAEFEKLLSREENNVVSNSTVPYIFTRLKRFNQSNSPTKVRKNLEALALLQPLFHKLRVAREVIDFTDEGVKYYASLALKQQLHQMSRRDSDTRLIYFYCFISHQYYKLNDTLAETIILSVNSFNHQIKKVMQDHYLETKSKQDGLLRQTQEAMKRSVINHFKIKDIVEDKQSTHTQMIEQIQKLIAEEEKYLPAPEIQKEIEMERSKNEFYFMEKGANKLIIRVSGIMKKLEFNREQSDNYLLLEAVDYYCQKDGQIVL